jgi:hypothetical protein
MLKYRANRSYVSRHGADTLFNEIPRVFEELHSEGRSTEPFEESISESRVTCESARVRELEHLDNDVLEFDWGLIHWASHRLTYDFGHFVWTNRSQNLMGVDSEILISAICVANILPSRGQRYWPWLSCHIEMLMSCCWLHFSPIMMSSIWSDSNGRDCGSIPVMECPTMPGMEDTKTDVHLCHRTCFDWQ